MRKAFYLLLVLLAFGMMACNRNHNPKPIVNKAVSAIAAADMVILDHGKMQFYEAAKQTLTPFDKETDSVVNAVYDENDHLYYSVLKDGKLSLKMLDLKEKDPQPVFCADWNLTLEMIIDHWDNKVSRLSLDADQKYVLIWTYIDPAEFSYDKTCAYDIATGQVIALTGEEIWTLTAPVDFSGNENFFSDSQNRFYHVTEQGKDCLNDKINFSQWFDEGEVDEVECTLESVSPDLKKVVYSAVVYWGEGWGYYCLADIDGSHQRVLEDSDIWSQVPRWLPDGSLAFIARVPLDEDDPDYEEYVHYEDDYVRILTPDGQLNTLIAASTFSVKPFGHYLSKGGVRIKGSDLVVLDKGRLVFYNSATDTFVPFEAEKDSVVNGLLRGEDAFYYTVAIGDELYLKSLALQDPDPVPTMLTDWDLKLDSCISETYGEMAPLHFYDELYYFGINHHFNWDYYSFDQTRYFAIGTKELRDHLPEDLETDSYDQAFLTWDEDMENFTLKGSQFYYRKNGLTCISDKLDLSAFENDPDYDPNDKDYNFISIDPTRKNVVYSTILSWGDFGHGPLCFASLDGKVQVALDDTDAASTQAGWLNDGSLVYVGQESLSTDDPNYDEEYNTTRPCLKRVSPDGTVSFFFPATNFVTK